MTAHDEAGEGDGQPKAKAPEGRQLGKEALRPALPRRFYTAVTVANSEAGFSVLLDGRPLRTPGKRPFAVPSRALAKAIAEEWSGQRDLIDPATMPMTRIVNSAIDAVAGLETEVADDIAAFAASDLLCYRAESPDGLAERQRFSWDPVVAWAERTLETRLSLAAGVMPVEQPASLRDCVLAKVRDSDPIRLACLHVMTTLTGSALLALAHAAGEIDGDAAWSAAHIDEDWQIAEWGEDDEARQRRAFRAREFAAASKILLLLQEIEKA